VVTAAIVILLVLLAAVGEWLHARRCRAAAYLAFGPKAKAREWTRFAPWLRLAGVGLTAWGLLTLMSLAPAFFNPEEMAEEQKRHLLLVLDVSPSMHIEDSGKGGEKKRIHRGAEVVRSLFDRLVMDQVRTTIIAVYTDAKPVVKEARDMNVIANILDDLPMEQAFDHGQTDLFAGVETAAEVAADWREGSATMLVLSDGDTLPDTAIPRLPRSIAGVLVAGVGDPRRGTLINGEQSRQDISTLRRLAGRLGGQYFDVNRKHLPSAALKSVDQALPVTGDHTAGLRELALASTVLGALLLAGVPFALGVAGIAPLKPARSRRLPRSTETQSKPRPDLTV